jgi:hypothetical protein
LSNTSSVIPVRNYYFDQLEKYSPFGSLFYSVRPIGIRVGDWGTIYHYKFFGHFESIDYRKRTMTLKDKDGMMWKFKYTTQMSRRLEFYELFPVTEEVIGKNNVITHKVGYIVTNMEEPEKTVPYFYKGDLVAIFWTDKRSVFYKSSQKCLPER